MSILLTKVGNLIFIKFDSKFLFCESQTFISNIDWHVMWHCREDEMVKVALLMNMAWIRGNYFKVLKLTTQLTPLQACIFHQKLNLVRMLVDDISGF